ncbi:nitrogen fixation protein NifQ [Paraburkholderia dinghuensis]|uniref:Nitrogen fixation protein NifQ n=1 Tax=Paraburkholderia dinghuensis TaxID=2305225 RepID=A0A3N6NEW8_9BURK|nr:nitrogen fixation protein NifQ [Paraburkholderia dinghuensis]RQH07127.1 nitrogen fixation protein NifQ [Paraburkholderia dinghuensis]
MDDPQSIPPPGPIRDGRAGSAMLAHAVDPTAPDTITFARLIGAKAQSNEMLLLGLGRDELSALIARHFPRGLSDTVLPTTMVWSPHRLFVSELCALLLQHDRTAATNPADSRCLATIIATACLRPDHLWRDLGLSGRDDVTNIFERHYPDLIERNVNGLRWKKFLPQEVALANGRAITFAPGCPGCEDFQHCYPQDAIGPCATA